MPQSFNYPISPIFIDDYIIGTSSNNENVTRNFKVGDVAAVMIGATGVGTVASISTKSSSFIDVTGGIITVTGDISMALSATGLATTDAEQKLQFLRGDGTWSLSGVEPTDIAVENSGILLTSGVSSINFTGNVRLTGGTNGFITVEVLNTDGIVDSVTAGTGIAPIIVTGGIATITNSGVLQVRAGGNVTLSGGTGDVTISTVSNAGTVTDVINGTGLDLITNSSSNPELDLIYTGSGNYLISVGSTDIITKNDFINYNKIGDSTVKSTKLRDITINPLTLVKNNIDLADLNKIHNNEPAGFNETPKTNNIIACTATEYAGINPKDINTLYFILNTSPSFTVTLDLTVNNQIINNDNLIYTLSTTINSLPGTSITGIVGTPYEFVISLNTAAANTYTPGNLPLIITGNIIASDQTLEPIISGTLINPPSGLIQVKNNLYFQGDDYRTSSPAVTELENNRDLRGTFRPVAGDSSKYETTLPGVAYNYTYSPKLIIIPSLFSTWRFYQGTSIWSGEPSVNNISNAPPRYGTSTNSGATYNYEDYTDNWAQGSITVPEANRSQPLSNWSIPFAIESFIEPIPYTANVAIFDNVTVKDTSGNIITSPIPKYRWEITSFSPNTSFQGKVVAGAQGVFSPNEITMLNNIPVNFDPNNSLPFSTSNRAYSWSEPPKPIFYNPASEGTFVWQAADLTFADENGNPITFPYGGDINSANAIKNIYITGDITYIPISALAKITLNYNTVPLLFDPPANAIPDIAAMSPSVANLVLNPIDEFVLNTTEGEPYRIPVSPNLIQATTQAVIIVPPAGGPDPTYPISSGGFYFNSNESVLTTFTPTFFSGTVLPGNTTLTTAVNANSTMYTDRITINSTLNENVWTKQTQYQVQCQNQQYIDWVDSSSPLFPGAFKYRNTYNLNVDPTTSGGYVINDPAFYTGPPGAQTIRSYVIRSGTTQGAVTITWQLFKGGVQQPGEVIKTYAANTSINNEYADFNGVENTDEIKVIINEEEPVVIPPYLAGKLKVTLKLCGPHGPNDLLPNIPLDYQGNPGIFGVKFTGGDGGTGNAVNQAVWDYNGDPRTQTFVFEGTHGLLNNNITAQPLMDSPALNDQIYRSLKFEVQNNTRTTTPSDPGNPHPLNPPAYTIAGYATACENGFCNDVEYNSVWYVALCSNNALSPMLTCLDPENSGDEYEAILTYTLCDWPDGNPSNVCGCTGSQQGPLGCNCD